MLPCALTPLRPFNPYRSDQALRQPRELKRLIRLHFEVAGVHSAIPQALEIRQKRYCITREPVSLLEGSRDSEDVVRRSLAQLSCGLLEGEFYEPPCLGDCHSG